MKVELWFKKSKNPGWIERLIKFRTLSDFSHVELAIKFDGDESYQCVSAYPEGVNLVLRKPAEEWVRVPIVGLTEQQKAKIYLKLEEIEFPDTYDFKGILEIAINRPSSDSSKWYCSELCCYLLQQGGIFGFLDYRKAEINDLYAAASARLEALNGNSSEIFEQGN